MLGGHRLLLLATAFFAGRLRLWLQRLRFHYEYVDISPLAAHDLIHSWPSQNCIGEGGLYSLWAGIAIVAEIAVLVTCWKGGRWRKEATKSENGQSI